MPDRPFPWNCPTCQKKEVNPKTITYTTPYTDHDGHQYEIIIPNLTVAACQSCGEILFDNNSGEQISHAIRQQLGRLQPQQILKSRLLLNFSQETIAQKLNVTPETYNRWETGTIIQSKLIDKQLRLLLSPNHAILYPAKPNENP